MPHATVAQRRASVEAWKTKNKDKVRAQKQRWRARHKDKVLASQQRRRALRRARLREPDIRVQPCHLNINLLSNSDPSVCAALHRLRACTLERRRAQRRQRARRHRASLEGDEEQEYLKKRREDARRRYWKDPDKARARCRQTYEKNKTTLIARRKAFYAANKDIINARCRELYRLRREHHRQKRLTNCRKISEQRRCRRSQRIVEQQPRPSSTSEEVVEAPSEDTLQCQALDDFLSHVNILEDEFDVDHLLSLVETDPVIVARSRHRQGVETIQRRWEAEAEQRREEERAAVARRVELDRQREEAANARHSSIVPPTLPDDPFPDLALGEEEELNEDVFDLTFEDRMTALFDTLLNEH